MMYLLFHTNLQKILFMQLLYNHVIKVMMASQITSLLIVYSAIYSGTDQRKHQSSMSLAFVQGIHRRLVNSLHKRPVMQKKFPFDDIIMNIAFLCYGVLHGQFHPYPSGLLHSWGNHTNMTAPVSVKPPWRIWINRLLESAKIWLCIYIQREYNHVQIYEIYYI